MYITINFTLSSMGSNKFQHSTSVIKLFSKTITSSNRTGNQLETETETYVISQW